MWLENPFLRMLVLIGGSMVLGYLARRMKLCSERLAGWLMTFVAVVGYSTVALLSIWGTPLQIADMLLPAIAVVQIGVMAGISLNVGRFLTKDRPEIGLFGITSAVGNHGMTMGGLVVFLIYGSEALGLSMIYCLTFPWVMVLLMYPVARHYSGATPAQRLGPLMLRSIFDWRSAGILFAVVGVVLSVAGVARPKAIETYHVVPAGVYIINVMAYFAIGLRLRVSDIKRLLKLIFALAGMRFVVAMGVCVCLLSLLRLSPWALTGLRWNVVLILSFVPTAVTNVAVANMFDLRPREASVLFVANTLMYLVLVLPIVFWVFA